MWDTLLHCMVPYLDLVVVAAGDEEGLLLVEADAAHRAVVLVELVQQGAHPVRGCQVESVTNW